MSHILLYIICIYILYIYERSLQHLVFQNLAYFAYHNDIQVYQFSCQWYSFNFLSRWVKIYCELILSTHSFFDGCLNCFLMLNIANNVAINMAVQGSLWFANLDSYGFVSSYGIPETFGSSVFQVWKKPHTYATGAATVYKYFSSSTYSPAFTVGCFC